MTNFRFNIKRSTTSAWEFVFVMENEELKIWGSNFMNPLESLFSALRLILKGEKEMKISMIDEPEENIWVFNHFGNVIKITILNFKDYTGSARNLEKGETIFNGEMDFNRFLNQLINSLQPFQNEKGINKKIEELVKLRRKLLHNNS